MTYHPSPEMRSATSGLTLTDSVYERLLQERIVVLGSEVNDEIANRITAQLLLLAAEDPDKDITLYINSPGGSVTAGMAIYDTMQLIEPDVSTMMISATPPAPPTLPALPAPVHVTVTIAWTSVAPSDRNSFW